MPFISHVFADRLTTVKIFCIFVLASYAHEAYLDFLLQILNKFLLISAVRMLSDEETVSTVHVSQIIRESLRRMQTE